MAGARPEARLNHLGTRVRLDQLLVARGLFVSREQARAAIMSGAVQVDGHRQDKAGTLVSEGARVEVCGPRIPFVGRGGVKLAAALDGFGIDPTGWTVLDIGASTGGFTDCWLQRGARRVYAVDVGYGQLAARLREDPRVAVRERVNARYLTPAVVDGQLVDAVSIDVSFISPRLIWPSVTPLLKPGAVVVELVKPQFEVGPARVGKGGVVRDPAAHRWALEQARLALEQAGLGVQGALPSPIRGAKGNREFLLWAIRGGRAAQIDWEDALHSE